MKKFLAILLAAMMVFALVACSNTPANQTTAITSPDDLNGKKVAVQMGTTSDDYITKLVDDGKQIEVSRYEKVTQCFDDLKLKRVDAVLVDSVVANYYMDDSANMNIAWKNTEGEPIGICLKKGNSTLTEAVEKAIDTMYFDGSIAELSQKHFGDDFTKGLRTVTEKPVIDTSSLQLVKEGTLMVAMEVGYPPMEYVDTDGTTFIGFDVEVAAKLAEILGLKIEYVNTAWDGIFDGVAVDRYDMVISSVSVTKERQENYSMTEPYIANQLELVVNK